MNVLRFPAQARSVDAVETFYAGRRQMLEAFSTLLGDGKSDDVLMQEADATHAAMVGLIALREMRS